MLSWATGWATPVFKGKDDELKALEAMRFKASEREKSDLKKVLSMPEGRRVFWRLLSACRIYQASYSDSAQHMAYNEGRRSVGLFVLNEINRAGVEALGTMQREANSDVLTNIPQKDAVESDGDKQ